MISVPVNAKLTETMITGGYIYLGFYMLLKFKSVLFLSSFFLLSQAKEGPCNTSRPGFWDMIGKAKW